MLDSSQHLADNLDDQSIDYTGAGLQREDKAVVRLDELLKRIRKYHPEADVGLVERAWHYAREAHSGQCRDSGVEYFNHPAQVAMILADLELDVATVAAGLLHDVLEDTDITRQDLVEAFGSEIARAVDGVTKLSRIHFQSKQEQQVSNLRKMFLAMAEDLRVVLVKLADRLHNMRTLHYLPAARRKKIANETLEIYTPLAHRLGMWSLKWEMEDIALKHLDPEAYYQIAQLVSKRRREREGELERSIQSLRQRLESAAGEAHVTGRAKHIYSIYQKMRQGKQFEEIYDLLALRVIVDTVKECYAVLGIVHTLWKPVPNRFKDYIAVPKSNMYQSLHTTVIGDQGDPLEVQIRTWEMHRIAEKGIAAHWLYKEGRGASEFEQKVAWLREVMEWLREMKDPDEFMATLKIDLFEDEVFVFTPKGDVKTLPAGATPVDFAFSVHTDVGTHCVGAKVNGRIVPLDYQLKNGEIVEILTANNASPSRDWLSFVKTSKARSKIRAWLKEEQREEGVARGEELLEREARKAGLEPKRVISEERLDELAPRYGLGSAADLLASIGHGKVKPGQVINKLTGREPAVKERKVPQVRRPRAENGVKVKGVDNLLLRFSKCCNPVPGDPIVGYITRGRGVSIHRQDCPNVAYLSSHPERRIEVSWNDEQRAAYPVEIEIQAMDRVNLLTNVMVSISEGRTNIEAVNARTSRDGMALINVVVDINDVEHMHNVINNIKQVDGVVNVRRAHPS